MELKEVLHYYVGQQVRITTNIEGNPVIETLTHKILLELDEDDFSDIAPDEKRLKPILRKLEDISDEEMIKWYELNYEMQDIPPVHNDTKVKNVRLWLKSDTQYFNASTIHYLLSRGFDLFNLIATGAALIKQ